MNRSFSLALFLLICSSTTQAQDPTDPRFTPQKGYAGQKEENAKYGMEPNETSVSEKSEYSEKNKKFLKRKKEVITDSHTVRNSGGHQVMDRYPDGSAKTIGSVPASVITKSTVTTATVNKKGEIKKIKQQKFIDGYSRETYVSSEDPASTKVVYQGKSKVVKTNCKKNPEACKAFQQRAEEIKKTQK